MSVFDWRNGKRQIKLADTSRQAHSKGRPIGQFGPLVPPGTPTPIRVIYPDGTVKRFASGVEAAKAHGISKSTVFNYIRRGTCHKGVRYEIAED